jgi:hypothetical protein
VTYSSSLKLKEMRSSKKEVDFTGLNGDINQKIELCMLTAVKPSVFPFK